MSDHDLDRWHKLQAVFDAALGCDETERLAFLSRECQGDPSLLEEVQQLLEHHLPGADRTRAVGPLPIGQMLERAAAVIPTHIGRYRIEAVISVGGMGTVYKASQRDPNRTVAVKVMRQGLHSASAARRFEYEAEMLARLSHPAIARIYEAGVHGDEAESVPYFAMEYVPDGRPITKYVQQDGLDGHARLELLSQVCDAIHHAHQKGIIHRDIKPSNILMDDAGQPRVIDFGVARAEDLHNSGTVLTQTGDVVGTPQYMSPEQCGGDQHAVDVRSDVYALGVVAYEVMSGKLPYDVSGHGFYKAAELVREHPPTPLSSFDTRLRGEVEVIIGKALEKDRDRRYQSAAELGEDIRLHLAGRAIRARPPSSVYLLQLFWRRNKAVCTASLVVFAALIFGTILITSAHISAEQERATAELERRRAGEAQAESAALGKFLTTMFDVAGPNKAGDMVSVRSLLEAAVQQLDQGVLAEQPLTEATMRETVAHLHGDWKKRSSQLTIAWEIRRREQGPRHPDTLVTASLLAENRRWEGKYSESVALARRTLADQRAVLGGDHLDTVETMGILAVALQASGMLDEPERLHREAITIRRRIQGDEHTKTLWSMSNLSGLLARRGRYDEAIQILRRVLETRRRVGGETHVDTLFAMERLAFRLRERGSRHAGDSRAEDLQEAEALARDILQVGGDRFGDQSPLVNERARYTLATSLRDQGEYAEAERLLREILHDKRVRDGPEAAGVAGTMIEIGILQHRKDELNEAIGTFREALQLRRKVFGDDHPYIGSTLLVLGEALLKNGALVEAEQVLIESWNKLARDRGDIDAETSRAVRALVSAYESQDAVGKAAYWREKLREEDAQE